MIFIKKIGLIFLIWIFIVVGVCIFLLNTSIGIYLVCTKITHCVPGLMFNSISGNWKNFHINGIKFSTSSSSVIIDRCNVILNYKHVFNKKIYVDYLLLEDIFINLKKNDVITKEIKINTLINMDNISHFFSFLMFKRIVLSNMSITSNNIVVKFKEIDNTGLIFHNNLLTILSTYVKGIILNISTTNNMLDTKVNIIHYYQHTGLSIINYMLKILSKRSPIKLSVCNIPIEFLIEKIVGQDLYICIIGNNCYRVDHFCLQTSLCNQYSDIHVDFNSSYGFGSITSNIKFKENLPLNIIVNYHKYNDCKKNNSNSNKNIIKINSIITGKLLDEICVRFSFVDSVSKAHMLLKTRITQFDIPISISIIGNKVLLPNLINNYKYIVEEFHFNLDGKMSDYCIKIISTLSRAQCNPVKIIMCGRGNLHSCVVSKLRINMLDGFFETKGTIKWDDAISWDNILTIYKVNVFNKFFKYPIELSGVMVMKGYIYADTWKIAISDLNIDGNIRNNRIFCTGSLYYDSFRQLKIPMLLVKWGSNMFKIKGELNRENYNFNAILNAPNCSTIIPDFSGSICGIFKMYGSDKFPVLFTKINLCAFRWNDKNIFIRKLIFNGYIDCNNVILSKIFLQINNIQYGILSLHKLIIEITGNMQQHYVNFKVYDPIFFGEVKGFGNFDITRQIWSIKVSPTSIVTSVGTWKLMQDVVCTYQHLKRMVIIQSHSWECVDCKIPMPNVYNMSVLDKVDTIFKRFNMKLSQIDLIPEVINMKFVYINCVDFSWIIAEKTLPQCTILLSGTQLNIESTNNTGCTLISPSSIDIKIKLIKTDFYCTWYGYINNSQIYGTIIINSLCSESKIFGYVYAQNIFLESFLKPFFRLKECMNGFLNIDIRFCGSIYCPKVYGVIRLLDINFNKIVNGPILIKNGKLIFNFFGDYVLVDGILKTDHDKKIYLNGNIINVNYFSKMKAYLKVKGNEIDLYISPEIKLKISPNIICTVTVEKICIRGDIDIPWARILMQELSQNIVDISSEEVILDRNFKPILENYEDLSIFISSNVTFHFGNDVSFNGFGLNIKLKGNLAVGYDKNGLMLTGYINFVSGNFVLYGQSLIIKKGQLLFCGKINQPYLDIEAVRSLSNKDVVIAGIRITGMLNQPKLEFFSNASVLSQQEIMSYLLGGRNPILSYADTNIITSLLIGASVGHSEKFINKLGKVFGIQDLTLNAQNVGTTSLIVLSGSIAPGLQIKYNVNIFDLLTTITVRYCLNSQFYLEATSGYNHTFDLLYRFDF